MDNLSSEQTRPSRFLYLRLLWNNLSVHPIRSGLCAVAIGLQVFLILLIAGLTSGILGDWRTRAEGIGADIMVQAPNSPMFFSFSSAVMPQSIVGTIAEFPDVEEAAGVLVLLDSGTLGIIYGADFKSFNGLSEGFTFLSGNPFTQPNEAIADDLAARARKLRVGDTTSLMNREFTVSGIVAHGKGARFFVPLATAQDIIGAEEQVSIVYVRSTGDTEAVLAELEELLPGYRIRSVAEYMSLMTSSNLPEIKPFINSFVGLGIVISFLVILLTMYTMVLEAETGDRHSEDPGGVTDGNLPADRCRSASAGSAWRDRWAHWHLRDHGCAAIKPRPPCRFRSPRNGSLRSILVAVVGALAGSAYPALRAARSDPVDALAYG